MLLGRPCQQWLGQVLPAARSLLQPSSRDHSLLVRQLAAVTLSLLARMVLKLLEATPEAGALAASETGCRNVRASRDSKVHSDTYLAPVCQLSGLCSHLGSCAQRSLHC